MALCRRKRRVLPIGIFIIALVYISAKWTTTFTGSSELCLDQPQATTGKVFSGRLVRKFPLNQLRFASFNSVPEAEDSARNVPRCERWAVLTTIFEPSEAVRRQVRLRGWCLVVVGDRTSPLKYETGWRSGEGSYNDAVVYLSPDEQEHLNSPFVDALPWNHFGRKNVGYLYAITHGARVIWDFDDDNMLKFFIEGAAPTGSPSIDAAIPAEEDRLVEVRTLHNHSHPTYNPYPALGAPSLPSWPRGLPPADIKMAECHNSALKSTQVPQESIAVLQSLADYQPDVDAIYRITMPIPFFFRRVNETRPLMIPTRVLTPYNAQATLHFKNSFWALLLPVTVHGRVSDIWRSYIAQRLFWDTGLQVGFTARPLVVQNRNPHSNLGDLNGEQDLYMKSENLVKLLNSWRGKGTTLVERIEELWVTLYEHRYIEFHDVVLVQLWIQTLLKGGYKFPRLVVNAHTPVPLYYTKARDKQQEEVGDDKSQACEASKPLTFWTSDMHDGTRAHMASVLSSLGHKVLLLEKKEYFPYQFVYEMKGVSQYFKKSTVLANDMISVRNKLTEQKVKDNFEFYKNDYHMGHVDAFFCLFPSAKCEVWMPFNKTIVFLPAHRYNLGRCTEMEWKQLNKHLHLLASMDSPRHIIAAASVYDQEYLRHYTGLDPIPLFSFSGFYTNNNLYAPTRDKMLLFGWGQPWLLSELESLNIIPITKLYRQYTLSDLVSHRAVVYIAYSVMSYKLTELYSLAIPLFMPSMKFYRYVQQFGQDRSSLSSLFCQNKTLDDQIKPHPSSSHPYSPNLEAEDDSESEYYWLQFADFYQWPHITYFDNVSDLKRKLEVADFDKIHNLMVIENERRKKELQYNWCRATKNIQTGRRVPLNYNLAIRELYNTTRLQVY